MMHIFKNTARVFIYIFFFAAFLSACQQASTGSEDLLESGLGEEGYDGPMERDLLEFEKTKDPALNRIPIERLWDAMLFADNQKSNYAYRGNSLIWSERGPIFDSVGPSNGNGRGGASGTTWPETYTAGRVRGVLVDANDASGNTVLVGGVAGGIWRCTNFLSATPNWIAINDFLPNLAVSDIAQHPTAFNIMYFTTGDPASNSNAVLGKGVWKSIDGGLSWTLLSSTSSYTRIFKIIVDTDGTLYLATRLNGLLRSTNGGTSWTSISPTGLTATNSTYVTDIELSENGRLHASFGYTTSSSGGTINIRYTDNPTTVSSSSGWNTPTGIVTAANRIELAALGNTLYAAPTNSSNNVVSTYKSSDNGETWTKNNTTDYTTGVSNTQGWYNITLEINPADTAQIIVGGLDAYRSLNSGTTVTRLTRWVSTAPYAHADHHFAKWWQFETENRMLMGTDGGLFLSRDNGATFKDKNRGLAIKQFYSCAIHPTLTNYFLGGAQDNGSHQFKHAGLASSVEVTGGDGAFVAIDQNEPQFQFTSYVYNQYRRSTNGGTSWSSFNLSSSAGLFINPFAYDDLANIMYCSNGTTLRRWENPTTATNTAAAIQTTLTIPGSSGNLSTFLVSPYTPNKLFFGTSTGKIFRIENADVTTSINIAANTTELTGIGFAGYMSCIGMGSSENFLVAVSSSYGVNNVWYSADAGSNWSAIDGNLPDMPVRWAVFDPFSNDKLIIATEAGVFTTSDVNGSSTIWTASAGFPTVRTDMLKLRPSDNLLLAATHGRGMWSTNIYSQSLPVKSVNLFGSLNSNGTAQLKWTTTDETTKARYHLQYSSSGNDYVDIADLPYNVKSFTHNLNTPIGYYRIKAVDINQSPLFSNIVAVKASNKIKGLQVKVLPNPVKDAASFVVSNDMASPFSWMLVDNTGKLLQRGTGKITVGAATMVPLQVNQLTAGTYRVVVTMGKDKVTSGFVKQ